MIWRRLRFFFGSLAFIAALAVVLVVFSDTAYAQRRTGVKELTILARRIIVDDSLRVGGPTTVNGTLTVSGVKTFAESTYCSGVFRPARASVLAYTDSSLQLTSAHFGKIIATAYAGAQYFTLPDSASSPIGSQFWLLNNADQNLFLIGLDNIVADGVLTSDLVSFQTTSHKIGGLMQVTRISTTKWHVANQSVGCTMTVEAAD